ncbi:phosphopantothenate--cysteine ligase [Streptococcus cameli]
MKILITSGGTSEAIDQVRSITNHSTGYLGKRVAEVCLAAGHTVSLVTTKQAVKPESHPNLTIYEIKNVADLVDTMEPLVKSHDSLIHSMAVSDYTPVYMTCLEEVKASEKIEDLLERSNSESKISSADEVQVLFLKKTPKVISLVKEWNPSISLIGFKLLVDVSKEELLRVARASLEKNKADYIVANDLLDIKDGQHIAYIVDAQKEKQVQTKDEIAQTLLSILTEREG